ncbi:hypothetical protein R1flu_003515 [Riccia fluitans]|uniref:Uncharacterized protein n=1 Tax=Riccia fluitans TaxID=41844 RepID=A0ABD1Y9A5_9MARC
MRYICEGPAKNIASDVRSQLRAKSCSTLKLRNSRRRTLFPSMDTFTNGFLGFQLVLQIFKHKHRVQLLSRKSVLNSFLGGRGKPINSPPDEDGGEGAGDYEGNEELPVEGNT